MSNLTMSSRMMTDRRWMAVAALVLALASPSARAAGTKPIDVENIRVGFEERFKVSCWTPVWVQVRGGLEGFSGVMEIVATDESGTPTRSSQSVQVGPGGSQRLTSYVRVGSQDSDFATIRFYDGKTGRQAIGDIVIGQAMSSKMPEPLSQDDFQILALGSPRGVDQIPLLPGFNANKNNQAGIGRAREVSIAQLKAADDFLPGKWYGYDAVDVIALDTNDKEMLATITVGRGEALRQWVERGGHLVVSVSGNWQAVNDSVLAQMLPARITGQTQVTPYDALEAFTGGTHQVSLENASAQVAKMEDVEARGGKVIASTLSSPLVVRGSYGFGRVTLIGLDTDIKPFATWPDRNLFWVKALDLKGTNLSVDAQANQQRLMAYYIGDMATQLRRALDQFAGVTLIPFAWVAGFIVLYILLIGPGDYFFLKKVLKRMELTWITFPTIVVTVSLLAYYAAYMVKGTDLRINKVDLVDIDLEAGVARGTSWFNLFSPQNRDYSVEVVPLAADRPVPEASASPTPAPPGTEVVVSWFGAPEPTLRGTSSRNRGMGFGASGYSYASMSKLEDVRIPIWSTKDFVARWFGPSPAAGSILDVDIQPSGADRLSGTITNRLPYALKNVIVVYGKQVYYKVGTLEPGATVEIDKTFDRSLSSYLSEPERRRKFIQENYYGNGNETISRAELLREMMFYESDTNLDALPPNRTHHEVDLTGLLAIGRPMLVAEIDRPSVQLVLGNKPGEAKIELTSLVRIILPLKKDAPKPK